MRWGAERPLAAALAVRIPGAAPRHPDGLVPVVPPASPGPDERALGVAQGPGRSRRLPREIPGGRPGQPLRAPAVPWSAGERSERVVAGVPPSAGDEARRDGRPGV